MKVMLSGDFINVGSKFCHEFGLPKDKKVTVLFCNYAFESADAYNNAQKNALRRAFNVGKIIDLTPSYDFKDDIDVIFVNGGYGFANVIEKFVDAGHDKKIKDLVKHGTVYIGESTGAVVAGEYSYPEYFEEITVDVKTLNKRRKNFNGLHFVDGVVLTHMSRFRFPKNFVDDTPPSYRILNRTSKGVNPLIVNLQKIKQLKVRNIPYISIKENEVLMINDGVTRKRRVDWTRLPVRENVVTSDEQKIKDIIAKR